MPHPPIQLFLTTIASQPALRQRQEYILRVLQVKKVEFTSYDLASDEDAKKLWKRKAPIDKQQLPGLLIGGEFPGSFQDFEDAVEFNELDQYLRLKEEWNPLEEDRPILRAVPVGIPGAYSPAQMNPEHISPAPSPIKTKPSRREGEIDAGVLLGDSSLHGVDVTEDDLEALVKELGLTGADAEDLVKGLSGEDTKESTPPPPAKIEVTAPEAEEGIQSLPAKGDDPGAKNSQDLIKEEAPTAAEVVKIAESERAQPAADQQAQVTVDKYAKVEEPAKVENDESATAELSTKTSKSSLVDEKHV